MNARARSIVAQVGIVIFGTTGVFLSQSGDPEIARWACISGLMSQPFFFYAAISTRQWGMSFVNVLYAAAWARGLITWGWI